MGRSGWCDSSYLSGGDMGELIPHETFLFYQARNQEAQTRQEAINEHLQKVKILLGYEPDPIYEADN